VPALRTSRCALGLKVSQFVIRLVIFSQLSQASDFNVLDDAVPALRTSRCALGLKVSQFVIRLVIFSQLSQASDFNVLDWRKSLPQNTSVSIRH